MFMFIDWLMMFTFATLAVYLFVFIFIEWLMMLTLAALIYNLFVCLFIYVYFYWVIDDAHAYSPDNTAIVWD